MNSRRFHKESRLVMQDAAIVLQNLCHRLVMASRSLLALRIPPKIKRRKGRIRVSHYDGGALIVRAPSARRDLYHRS
jgi:hypothetical protein